MNTYGAHDPMPCSVTDDGREFEPPSATPSMSRATPRRPTMTIGTRRDDDETR